MVQPVAEVQYESQQVRCFSAEQIYTSPKFLIGALATWLLAGAGIAWLNAVVIFIPFSVSLALILPSMLVSFAIADSGRFICRFFPIELSKLKQTIAVQAIYIGGSTALWLIIWYLYALLLKTILPGFVQIEMINRSIPVFTINVGLLTIIAMLEHYIILSFEQNRLASEQILQQKLALAQAELASLKNSVHPHFLFNSLAMMQSLVISSPEKAAVALGDLSEFLIYSVQFSRKEEVSIEDEIAHARHYAEIERLRGTSAFVVRWEIDSECNSCMIIPCVIQPLVENAIKHGVLHCENGEIVVAVLQSETSIILAVTNPVNPEMIPARKSGTGLDTLSRRLAVRYGSAGKITVDKQADSYSVKVTIPQRKG